MAKLSAGILILAGCMLAAVRAANAQTITLAPEVTHSRGGRGGNMLSTQLNIADCVNDDRVSFTLFVTGPQSDYHLEVWAGDACDVRTARTSSACWRLVDTAVSTNTPPPIVLPVRDILYGRTTASLPSSDPAADTGRRARGQAVRDAEG